MTPAGSGRITPDIFPVVCRFANRVVATAKKKAVYAERKGQELIVTFDDGSKQTTHEYDRR